MLHLKMLQCKLIWYLATHMSKPQVFDFCMPSFFTKPSESITLKLFAFSFRLERIKWSGIESIWRRMKTFKKCLQSMPVNTKFWHSHIPLKSCKFNFTTNSSGYSKFCFYQVCFYAIIITSFFLNFISVNLTPLIFKLVETFLVYNCATCFKRNSPSLTIWYLLMLILKILITLSFSRSSSTHPRIWQQTLRSVVEVTKLSKKRINALATTSSIHSGKKGAMIICLCHKDDSTIRLFLIHFQ